MVTYIYIGIMALIFVGLSFNVILRRVKNKTLFGDSGDQNLLHAVRVHGNFAEYVPFILLMMFLYESTGGSRYLIHTYGILLIASRALHAWGLMYNKVPGRLAGTVIVMLLMVMLGIMLIVKGVHYMSALGGHLTALPG